ncbi:hypothetical protein [Streptomyces sp. C]|uniref:hypothetical protein n=1 Tax=Streptomyces sp. C TaxID=253839 RepID=UPI0001B57822|nr:hypothetical protein [Streptomyces sp. C]
MPADHPATQPATRPGADASRAEADPAADGNVVLCTPEGAAAAERFHDLTGRPLLRAADLDEAGRLLADPGLTTALLSVGPAPLGFVASSVYRAHRRELGLGWIMGWRGVETAVAHAAKTASYRYHGDPAGLVWSSAVLGSVREATVDGLRLRSGPAPDLPRQLQEANALVALSSHGRGIDMWLGERMLCSAPAAASADLRGQAVYPCMQGGPCIRAREVAGRLQEPERVDVASVRADVLVLDSCRSLRIGLDAPGACLATAAVLGPHAGSVLAAVGDAEGTVAAHLDAWRLLRGGAPVHRAVAAENAANLAAAGSAPWVLLGDPLTRIPRSGGAAPHDGHVPEIGFVDVPGEAVAVVADEPEGSAPSPVWVQPLPGTGRAVVAVRGGPAGRVVAVPRSQDLPWLLREELLAAAPALATSRKLAAVAADLLPGPAAERAQAVAQALDDRLARNARLLAGRPAAVVDGGRAHDRLQWHASELSRWQQLHEDLGEVLAAFTRALGPMQTALHLNARETPAAPGEPTEWCPYCGSPANRRRFRLDTLSRARHAVVCWSCDLVYDGPPASRGPGPPSTVRVPALLGPLAVPAGQQAEYRLVGIPPAPSGVRAVRIAVESVPWPMPVEAGPVRHGSEEATEPEPRFAVLVPDGPPGLYSLVTSVVVRGETVTVKRPLHILPPDAKEPVVRT